jgi:hypothetical protein
VAPGLPPSASTGFGDVGASASATGPSAIASVMASVSPGSGPCTRAGSGSGSGSSDEASVASASAALADLPDAPFTLQRLCEVLTQPTRFYKRKRKLVSAVQRVRGAP